MRAVIYSRFSSDKQREASSEDQARNCRRRAEAEGWTLGAHYRDEAISGSTTARPGYQAMLTAAAAREFDVLLVDDLSRLSRDQVESERSIRRLEFGGTRIVAVSDGYDSNAKSRKVQRGVRGLMNEIYLDDLKDKTHRGLSGQALKRFHCGGKPYGYKLVQQLDEVRRDAYGNAAVIGTKLVIEPEQATVVREIFDRYSNDTSQRNIAAELNARRIPSPGSAWRGRIVRRGDGWLGSTIYEMLKNPLYRGEQVWNRTIWLKDPDTGKRVMRPRPQSEWIRHHDNALRIVDEELWERVEARMRRAAVRGAAVRGGLQRAAAGRGGRAPRYAFSGLLKCAECGSSLVIAGGTGQHRIYQCSGYRNGLACTNGGTAKQMVAEDRLAAALRDDLLNDEMLAELEAEVTKRLKAEPKADNAPKITATRERIANLVNAVAAGAARQSPVLLARLAEDEAELARLTADAPLPRVSVVALRSAVTERVRNAVAGIMYYMRREPDRARVAAREIVGDIPCAPDESGRFLVARLGLSEQLLRAVGGVETTMVAGAGFEPATFGL